jgi:uncharacterized membrane protein YgcG
MSKFFKFLIIPLLLIFVSPFVTSAKTYVYDSLDVTIDVRDNSDMIITEKFIYEFDGPFSGVFRGIKLADPSITKQCQADPTLQCGGFDYVDMIDVFDNEGNVLPAYSYNVETAYDYDSGASYMDVTWKFSETPIYFDKEKFEFTIKYLVRGGIGYFDDYDLFYWNVIFDEHEVPIRKANITVNFPENLENILSDDFRLLTNQEGQDYTWKFDQTSKSLVIDTNYLEPYEGLTLLVQIPKRVIKEPGSIQIVKVGIWAGMLNDIEYYINGRWVMVGTDGLIENVSPGNVNVEAKRVGYLSSRYTVEVKEGESSQLELTMSPNVFGLVLFIVSVLFTLIGVLGIPGAFLIAYWLWYTKGRDDKDKTTVVPEFSPPENISPVIAGSLTDEVVHMKDVSSVIIDCAYKGYLKIVQQNKSGSKFEFLKQKEFDSLPESEKTVLDSMFGKQKKTSTYAMQDVFYTKIPKIKDTIYGEMTTKGFFKKNPDKVRGNYVGLGILIIVLTLFILSPISIWLVSMTGFPLGIFALQCSLVLLGLIFIPLSRLMPAKTLLGSELKRRFDGFKMFLHHSERYRLQNLTPETFEKYLSYAVVFGVEKRWAKSFEGIYKGSPSWFEGQGDLNPLIIANSLSRMSSTTTRAMTSVPSSSGSGGSFSGGGWSGGGGFSGGFSGGGGGGGRGGAF